MATRRRTATASSTGISSAQTRPAAVCYQARRRVLPGHGTAARPAPGHGLVARGRGGRIEPFGNGASRVLLGEVWRERSRGDYGEARARREGTSNRPV